MKYITVIYITKHFLNYCFQKPIIIKLQNHFVYFHYFWEFYSMYLYHNHLTIPLRTAPTSISSSICQQIILKWESQLTKANCNRLWKGRYSENQMLLKCFILGKPLHFPPYLITNILSVRKRVRKKRIYFFRYPHLLCMYQILCLHQFLVDMFVGILHVIGKLEIFSLHFPVFDWLAMHFKHT